MGVKKPARGRLLFSVGADPSVEISVDGVFRNASRNEKARRNGRALDACGQIPLANCIVLGGCDEGVTDRYEKPGAGPGFTYAISAEAGMPSLIRLTMLARSSSELITRTSGNALNSIETSL